MQLLECKWIRITSYHPAANGLIEHFHHQLKASLKAHPNPTHWTDSLPFVLLGVRTQLKDDLHCTAAELVYGTTLHLPGEFFDESDVETIPDPVCYVTRLKHMMKDLQVTPVHKQMPTNTHVSPMLKSYTRVFVCHDTVRKPLQKPYDGPYKVQKRAEKHYTIDINGHDKVISIDHLKPTIHDVPPTGDTSPSTIQATIRNTTFFQAS